MQGSRKGILIFVAVLAAVAAGSAFARMLGQENQAWAIDSYVVTGELVHQSKAIQPGSYIEEVKWDKTLAKGEYPAAIYLKG